MVDPTASLPKPPSHLSKEASEWWKEVVAAYHLEPHHLRLLEAACGAWTRMEQARDAIAQSGLTFRDSNGNIKANPACAIERDNRTAFARLVRELQLDDCMAADLRPPALAGNRGH